MTDGHCLEEIRECSSVGWVLGIGMGGEQGLVLLFVLARRRGVCDDGVPSSTMVLSYSFIVWLLGV